VFDKELAMLFTVLQIQITDDVYRAVNRLGHEGGAAEFPQYRAYMDTMFRGSDGYKSEYAEYYTPVCVIEADSLNRVFDIGNIGPEDRITRLARMHSVSVGDIIVDPDGVKHMVNSFGFEEIA
jgi:hypothetical protein